MQGMDEVKDKKIVDAVINKLQSKYADNTLVRNKDN